MVKSILREQVGKLMREEVVALEVWLQRRLWEAETGRDACRGLLRRKYVMATYFDSKWQSNAKP